MFAKLKIIQIGNSLGVALPNKVLTAFDVAEGDTIVLTEAPGGYYLLPSDPDLIRQLKIGREVMKKRRGVLRALAK